MVAVSPKADVSWVQGFQEKWREWFPVAKPLLEAHQGPAAFKTYPFVSFSQTPWSPPRIPLFKGGGLFATFTKRRRALVKGQGEIENPSSKSILISAIVSKKICFQEDLDKQDLPSYTRPISKHGFPAPGKMRRIKLVGRQA